MGGASPYRARSHPGQNRDSDGVLLGENGEKYFGLVNVSNTCYANSVLQALYFCAPFRKAVIRHLVEDKDEDDGDSLLMSLSELFAQIDSQKRAVGCLTPRKFLARLRKANELFNTSEHQDAHEFMQFLLNDIAENLKSRVIKQREREKQNLPNQQSQAGVQAAPLDEDEKTEEEPRTWIHDLFQGYLVNQMKCLCCENVTVRREAFLDLSVDIERHTSIAACLRAFESTELLRSANKFFCDMCGCLQEAEKRLRIYQLPSVLMLHLKRFKYIERLGRSCRLPYRVVFPLQLKIVENRPPRRSDSGGNIGAFGGEPSSPSQENETPGSPTRPRTRLFELRSVVVHIGRDSSRGHYVTIVRSADRCVLLDDDVVRVVEPEVLRSFYGTAGPSRKQNTPEGNLGSNDRNNPSSSSSGLGANDGTANETNNRTNSQDRSNAPSPPMPLYERSPEGTCCGYLLLYEAVDGLGAPDHDPTSVLDLGAVVDWISEERNLTDSDSGDSADEQSGCMQDRQHVDDSELTQAFEQRCIPRGLAARSAQYGSPAPSSATGTPGPQDRERDRQQDLDRISPSTGHGAFAWTVADDDSGRLPTSGGSHSYGVRTLGSVVPAAGNTSDAVSPSRVNVTTMPSPNGSETAS